jgi:glycosyltransferase involved in cell wall biosynthesis
LECIVVDDDSTDETEAVVKAYDDPRIEYIGHEENCGASAARNTAIEAASGEYLALLDSDDAWVPEKLERQLRTLDRRDEEWGAAYCDVTYQRTSLPKQLFERFSRTTSGEEGGVELVPSVLTMDINAYAGSTLLVEMGIAEAVGGFDEAFPRHQDLEFLVRVLQRTKLAYVPEPLVRIHESGAADVATLKTSKELFYEKFDDEIYDAIESGHDVFGAHRLNLAKAHFRDGQLKEGASHLRGARFWPPRQIAAMAFACFQGIRLPSS